MGQPWQDADCWCCGGFGAVEEEILRAYLRHETKDLRCKRCRRECKEKACERERDP